MTETAINTEKENHRLTPHPFVSLREWFEKLYIKSRGFVFEKISYTDCSRPGKMKARSSIIISLGLLAVVFLSAASSADEENSDTTTVSTTEEYSHPTNSSDNSEETEDDSARKNFQTFCGSNAVAGCKCDGTTVTCNCKDTDSPSEVSTA